MFSGRDGEYCIGNQDPNWKLRLKSPRIQYEKVFSYFRAVVKGYGIRTVFLIVSGVCLLGGKGAAEARQTWRAVRIIL